MGLKRCALSLFLLLGLGSLRAQCVSMGRVWLALCHLICVDGDCCLGFYLIWSCLCVGVGLWARQWLFSMIAGLSI